MFALYTARNASRSPPERTFMFGIVDLAGKRPLIIYLGGFLSLLALAGGSIAATTTSTFTVQLTITASCVIDSATTLNFGSTGVIGANIDQTSTLTISCTNTTPYNIGLNAGTATGATVTTRKMTSGANTVSYSHSSTLRTFQEIFGLSPLLGDAANATDLSDLFQTFP